MRPKRGEASTKKTVSDFPTPVFLGFRVDRMMMKRISHLIDVLFLGIVVCASAAQAQTRNAEDAAASERRREATLQRYLEKLRQPDELGDIRYFSMLRDLDLPASRMIEIYIGLLDNDWDWVQQRSLEALATYGREANLAKTPALALLNAEDSKPYVRRAAAQCLGSVAPEDKAVIDAMQSLLENNPPTKSAIKLAALRALAAAGVAARDSKVFIREYLKSNDAEMRYEAYRTLGMIDEVPSTKVAALTPDQLTREDSYPFMQVLVESEGEDRDQANQLLEQLIAAGVPVHMDVAVLKTLTSFMFESPILLGYVLDCLGHDDAFVRANAAQALDGLNPAATDLIPLLVQALERQETYATRQHVANALQSFGARAEPAVPQIIERLESVTKDISLEEVGAYLDLLRAMGPRANMAGESIVKILSETSPLYQGRSRLNVSYLRAYFLITLADIGVPQGALPYILEGLEGSDKSAVHLYAAAARAAGALGPDAAAAVPLLERSLKGELPSVSLTFDGFQLEFAPDNRYTTPVVESIRALGRIGTPATRSLPILREIASKEDPPAPPGLIVPGASEEAMNAITLIEADNSRGKTP